MDTFDNLELIHSRLDSNHDFEYHSNNDILQINPIKDEKGIVSSYEAIIRITQQCNSGCRYCFVHKRSYPDDLDIFKKVVLALSTSRKNVMLVFSGGEPTIFPGFIKLLKFAHKLNFYQIRIQTNGILFSNNDFLDKLKEIEYDFLFFTSLPSTNPEVYAHITRTNYYDHAVKGIQNLALNYKVELNLVINKLNYRDLGKYLEFIRSDFNFKNIKLRISNLGILNFKDSDDFIVSYSDVIDSFSKVLFDLSLYKFEIQFTSSGGCGFPFCIISQINPRLITPQGLFDTNPDFIGVDNFSKGFYKTEKCGNCYYDPYCLGFPSEYIQKFDNSEIKPISNKIKI